MAITGIGGTYSNIYENSNYANNFASSASRTRISVEIPYTKKTPSRQELSCLNWCSAVVLSAYILKKIEEGIWKRVLFVPTGALLSKTSFNEGQTIPGIAHGVVLEHYEG